MATVTASQFVSRSVHGNSHGVGSETKANNMAKMGLRSQNMTFNGLRSLKMVDRLQMRARAVATKVAKEVYAADQNGTPSEITIEGSGMCLAFIATEVGPLRKTGGLSDVLGGLPPAMAARGHRVMTIAPRYDQYKDAWDTCVGMEIKVRNRVETVRYFHCYKRGVDRVFVDHPWFLEKVWGKTGSKIYGPRAGEDYQDNQLRFSLFCLAALEAPRVLSLNNSKNFSGPYGENVIFIANDGPLPYYLKAIYQSHGIYSNAKVKYPCNLLESSGDPVNLGYQTAADMTLQMDNRSITQEHV